MKITSILAGTAALLAAPSKAEAEPQLVYASAPWVPPPGPGIAQRMTGCLSNYQYCWHDLNNATFPSVNVHNASQTQATAAMNFFLAQVPWQVKKLPLPIFSMQPQDYLYLCWGGMLTVVAPCQSDQCLTMVGNDTCSHGIIGGYNAAIQQELFNIGIIGAMIDVNDNLQPSTSDGTSLVNWGYDVGVVGWGSAGGIYT